MATTRDEIRTWLEKAKESNATHVIVACDTFDYEDYPVPVFANESVREAYFKTSDAEMQRVMEVYALHLDFDVQLDEHRSFHFEGPGEKRVTLDDVLQERMEARRAKTT